MIFRTPRVKIEGSVESTQDQIILETSFTGVERFSQGKVRDVYRVGDQLLIVATDRISAFDFILPTGIPDKGRVLTQMSVFWFDFLRDVTATHFITADVNAYPPELRPFRAQLEGRSMLVKRAEMAPIECVARGYLAGSGWKEYRASGTVCDIPLPKGLQESSRLPEPIFTPATKAQTGHDENISFERMAAIVGMDVARQLRDLTLAIYQRAAVYAESRGIIIADTKFEFGFVDGKLVLGDEVLTPDSSRFWPRDTYQPGKAQNSYDKQYVRDYLETIHWNKQPPAPALPPEVAQKTGEKYREAYRLLTGKDL
jgi:phosphoribosylaminoimidazole-succinocarboxamide synthase